MDMDMDREETDVPLIDDALIPDPDADEEMGAGDAEAIADEDVRGSRLLLVRRAVETIDADGTPAGVVQMVCTFQPADGARFASAQFRLRLLTPEGVRILDLQPRVVDDDKPAEVTISRKGQLTLKTKILEPSAEIGSSRKYVRYHCMVQGAGEGTALARWDFRENPDRRDGIGREQVLTLTLPATGRVTGEVIVGARLVRKGVGGAIDAVRDLILGPRSDERSYPVAFDIPSKPSSRSALERFFGLY